MQLSLFKSLQFRLPSSILLGTIPTTLIAIALASFSASKIIHQNTQDNLALQAKAFNHQVSQWIEMNGLVLTNLSQQPAIISLDPQQQKPILETFVNTYEYFYLAHTTDLNGVNLARSDNQAAQNYGDTLWFQEAKQGENLTFQTSMERTSNKLSLCMSTPAREQNQIVAIVSLCHSLEALTEQVGTVRFGQTGYSFIVDERGRPIEHPDTNLISGDELQDYSAYPPVAQLLEGEQGYFPFTDEAGIEWVSYGTRLDNGWGIFVLQQKSEAFASATQFKQLVFLITIIAIFAVSILTWFFIDRFTQPIEQITASAKSLAEGDLDASLEIDRGDEIGILAQSLNSITRRLQEYSSSSDRHQLELDRLLEQQNSIEREQKLAQDKLEKQVRELETKLALVDGGDLTIQATVTDDEIGRLAATYNSMVDNLRSIIDRVKTATQTVAFTTNSSENAISALSQGTLKQTAEIDGILAKIQNMSGSIQNIAVNAEQAETIIKQASSKIKAGDTAIEQTVDKIIALGQTTKETKEQAKRLGKASRKIAKAVELIRKIALQTNVLAVNTSIEAARAGEEGLGFNVVADEVQSLAAQSAQTATEIEKLVLEMQAETSKVIQAMEESNERVIAGSKQVEETRFALKQVTTASQEIDKLVEAITNVVEEQSETSQVITANMQEVAAIAQNNSTSVNYVSDSFQELLSLAQELQASMGQFKVN